MKTIVYVDGFNLYYGCLKGTPYRWLDLRAFAEKMMPRDKITEIKYFTARVDPRPTNPGARADQDTYLRALRTLSGFTPYYGQFLTNAVRMRRVHKPRMGKGSVLVWKTEEKGSDVNLATQLLVDGFDRAYELAVVVSNDGDLKAPIRYVRHKLGLRVGVLNPRKKRSYVLSPSQLPPGSFYKPIRAGVLASSQFPDTLSDAQGSFSKPTGW